MKRTGAPEKETEWEDVNLDIDYTPSKTPVMERPRVMLEEDRI